MHLKYPQVDSDSYMPSIRHDALVWIERRYRALAHNQSEVQSLLGDEAAGDYGAGCG